MPAMTGGRRFIAGLATIGVATMLLTATAQQPPASAPPPPTPPSPAADQPQLPTFRTGANIVRVDVTVLDHRGNPVPTLKAEDFRIEEDGIPRR